MRDCSSYSRRFAETEKKDFVVSRHNESSCTSKKVTDLETNSTGSSLHRHCKAPQYDGTILPHHTRGVADL